MTIKMLSKASLAAFLIVLSPFAKAAKLSENDILFIRNSLQELKIDDRQFSNQDIEFLIWHGLDLKDFESNLENIRLNQNSKTTCHSTKCHVGPY